MRALYWSNGLRALLKEMGFELDERQDQEVAADEASAGTPLACIPAATWYRHIARHKGRALALLKAAEKGGVVAVRALIESWDLTWGLDVLEAEELPEGAAPTADEVLRRMERADLADRMAVWRDEFDRVSREERAGRIVPQTAASWEARADAQADADRRRVREMTSAEKHREVFLAAHRKAKEGRADEIAAALARVREKAQA